MRLTLIYDDLQKLPAAAAGLDLPLRHGLDGARRPLAWHPASPHSRSGRAAASAHALRFVSSEHPYEDSLTIEQALLPDVMLALDLDGSPLSRPHGAPLRLVIPEMYGYKGVKWLERIEVVAEQPTGFWENLGYDQNAWVGKSNGYG